MSQIVIDCPRWLGILKRYVVRVDGREVGRLGGRTHRVAAPVAVGQHSVIVDCYGRATPEEHVNVPEDEDVRFELIFNATYAEVASRPVV